MFYQFFIGRLRVDNRKGFKEFNQELSAFFLRILSLESTGLALAVDSFSLVAVVFILNFLYDCIRI